MIKPPFYPNPDNNHCLQCAVRMAHNFLSAERIDGSNVDSETEYDPHYYTWTVAGAKFLARRFPGVRLLTCETFDYGRFRTEGEAYLETVWSRPRLENQKANASPTFEREKGMVADFLGHGTIEYVQFTPALFEVLTQDNLLVAQVNWNALYQQAGETTHFVLLYEQHGADFELHDPGPPGREGIRIPGNTFLASFRGELIAIPAPEWRKKEAGRNEPCPCGSGKKYTKCHGATS